MLIRVQVDGEGTDESPFRVNLPTYQMIQHDPLARVAIVSIPDADWPSDERLADALPDPPRINAKKGTKLNKAAIDAWHAHLDERYKEHAGKFRAEIV